MRAYTVVTAAVALSLSSKTLDNILSHHAVPGVSQSRQGIARKLTPRAMLILDITFRLADTAGMSISRSLHFASDLAQGEGAARRSRVDSVISLEVDVAAIESSLALRLAHAVEIAPQPRRGRPTR